MPWKRNRGGGYRKPGAGGNVRKPRQYEALRRKGLPKARAAAVTNAGKKAQRKGGRRGGRR